MIKSGRRTLTGCAVGSGWVQGQIRRVDDPEDGVALRHIAPHEVADEVRQLDGAIDAVVTQMRRALDKFQERRNLIVEGGDVLNAHLNLAKDQEIRRRVVDMITDKQINASWGLKAIGTEHSGKGTPLWVEPGDVTGIEHAPGLQQPRK